MSGKSEAVALVAEKVAVDAEVEVVAVEGAVATGVALEVVVLAAVHPAV
jgi:hypothetical protein